VNPLILSIDTTHEFGSIALLAGSEVVEEALLHATDASDTCCSIILAGCWRSMAGG